MKNLTGFLKVISAFTLASLIQAFAAPASLTQSVTYNGETITMQLQLEPLRGPDFELLAQNASGTYDTVTPVDERSYLGSVDEYPGAVSCGVLQDDGQFRGAVYFDRGATWFTLGENVVETRALNYSDFTAYQIPSRPTVGPGQAGTTTYLFDIGIDADYDYYTTSNSSVAKSLESIEYSVCLTRAIYLRDALLKPQLGRVIVRTDQANNPYEGLTQGNYLDRVRSEWNTNQSDTDPDVVAGVSPTKIGGGLAWVGVVGTSSAYSVNQCNASGNFDVVFRHELGHNWDLGHFVGGSPEGAGLMGGNAPGRFSGCEVYRVLNHRNAKINAGGILDDAGTYNSVELPPYASMDVSTFTQSVDSSITIPVLDNDHDANGQALSLVSFESDSAQGGSITQEGDQLVYTAPGAYLGTDYFHYTINDSTDKPATGVVIIDVLPGDPLRLYLPLDETTGTAANDLSVFGNNASLTGSDFATASSAGVFGNSVTLDGVNNYLSVNGLSVNSNSVTLSAWIKPNGVQNSWTGVIFSRSSGAAGLNFRSNSGQLGYHWGDNYYNWASGLTPPDNTWTFVALVVEPTQATLYMNDGSGFVSSTNVANHTPESLSSTLIGRDPNSSSRSFNGQMDEVRIYEEALSSAELQSLFEGGAAAAPNPFEGAENVIIPSASWAPSGGTTRYEVYVGTDANSVATATTASPEFFGSVTDPEVLFELQTNTTYFWRVDSVKTSTTVTGLVWSFSTGASLVEPGLIGHWKFDDGSGTDALDSSTNSFTGSLNNGPTWSDGLFGGALSFDGADDSVNLGNGLSLSGKADFTVAAWINTTSNTDQVIIQQRNGGFNGQFQFRVNSNGTLNFYLYGNGAYQFDMTTSQTVNDGQWHYVSAVREGDNGYIFIDGNPTPAASGSGAARDLSGSIGMAIGRDIRDNSRSFNGIIDEVKFYGLAKSGGELEAYFNDYLTLSSPVAAGSWTFDEGSGTTTADTTGNGYDGTLSGASWTVGRAGQALNFANTEVTLGAVPLGSSITLAAWVKPTSVDSTKTQGIISRDGSFNLKLLGDGLRFTTPTIQDHTVSNLGISAGQWQHIAITFDAGTTNGARFFLNGQLVGSANASSIETNTNALRVGNNEFDEPFEGDIDEILVFDEKLTDAQVLQLYSSYPTLNRPPSINSSSYTIAENAGPSVLGTPSANDPDDGDLIVFSISAGNESGLFSIDSASGAISTTGSLDYESDSSHSLTVTVSDYNGLQESAVISVTVTDVAKDDSDQDGLMDEWELTHFSSTNSPSPSDDPDGDGLNNFLEFAFGMNPNAKDNSAVATDGSKNGNPTIQRNLGENVSFDAIFSRRNDHGQPNSVSYTVEFSHDLVSWEVSSATASVLANSADDPNYEVVSLQFPSLLQSGQEARYFRVRIQSAE